MRIREDWGTEVERSRWASSCRWRLEGGRLNDRFGAPTGCGAWGHGLEWRGGLPLGAT